MTRAEFIEAVAHEIEEAIMRAQGVGDWMAEESPEDRAKSIANLLSPYTFSDDEDAKS